METIKLGKYRHYKGNDYEVIGIAKLEATLEEMVVYKKLEDFGKFKKGSLWVMPKKMFVEKVKAYGKEVPRFSYLGK